MQFSVQFTFLEECKLWFFSPESRITETTQTPEFFLIISVLWKNNPKDPIKTSQNNLNFLLVFWQYAWLSNSIWLFARHSFVDRSNGKVNLVVLFCTYTSLISNLCKFNARIGRIVDGGKLLISWISTFFITLKTIFGPF